MSAHRNVSHAANEAPETSARKRARKSLCWEHFDKMDPRTGTAKVKRREVVVEIITAKCKHCGKEFEHTSSKGTTHLNKHVESCLGLKAVRERTNALGNRSVDDTDRLDILLAKTMIRQGYPFHKGLYSVFQQFTPSLRPGYELPPQKRIHELLCKIDSDEDNKLRQVFDGVSSRISLSISKQDPYIYMTAFFIDGSWNWQQRIVNSLHLACIDAVGDLLYSPVYREAIKVVTIDDKAVQLLSDNNTWECFSIDIDGESLQSLDDRLREDFFSEEMKISSDNSDGDPIPLDKCLFGDSHDDRNFRIKCAIEVINEAAEKGTSLYKELFEKIYFTIKGTDFFEYVHKINVHKINVHSFRCTWTSAFCHIKICDNELRHVYNHFNEHELGRLRVLKECWSYFHDAYELLNEFKYVSSGVFFVKLCEMQSFLKNQPIYMDAEINTMVQEMKRIVDVYWGSHKILLSITCFLDPRYKMTKIKEHCSLIFENDGECTKFEDVIIYLMNVYVRMEGSNDYSSQECEDELKRYLSEECLHRTDDEDNSKIDVLKWWKDNESFGILKKMAKDFLGIPLVSNAKASLVHDLIPSDEEEDFDYDWDTTSEYAPCLYVWLKEENEDTERAENRHGEDP